MSGKQATGLAVDASGGAVIDPTKNVLDLTAAEAKRQDDLRAAETRLTDAKLAHVKEISELRAKHQHQLDEAESKRLDSIRQVDREEVIKTALAVVNTAETLRGQVSNSNADVNKRLSALELASSEGKGKQTVADPMLVELVAEVKALRTVGATAGGKSEGAKNLWGYIVGGIGLLILILKALGKI